MTTYVISSISLETYRLYPIYCTCPIYRTSPSVETRDMTFHSPKLAKLHQKSFYHPNGEDEFIVFLCLSDLCALLIEKRTFPVAFRPQ